MEHGASEETPTCSILQGHTGDTDGSLPVANVSRTTKATLHMKWNILPLSEQSPH